MSENIISLSPETIDDEIICCAMSDKKSAVGVNLKKKWLKERFAEGLKFKRLDVRHKVFIEYLPADAAWSPVVAPGYMFINCFWVAGSYKGKGYGSKLFGECATDAKGMNGIVVVTSRPKKPYMSERGFFLKRGFEVCDTSPPYFELLVKRFKEDAPLPRFADSVKAAPNTGQGWQIYYTDQCPFTDHYTRELEHFAKEHNIPLQIHKITTREEARSAPSPYTTFGVYYNGRFITHEIITIPKFEKLVGETSRE